jgi:c-di-GMP-binding flagellar brake protein YcgR
LIPKRDEERRRHGRLRCDSARCELGELIDLSASGMRVRRRGHCSFRNGHEVQVQIGFERNMVSVNARVVHVEKRGFRVRIVGFEFVDLTDEQRRKIVELARNATDQLLLG